MSRQSTASTRDLFDGDEAGKPKASVSRLPAQKPGESYTAERYRGSGRAGAGAPPSRHVYRRHRRKGAASPVRRSLDNAMDEAVAGHADSDRGRACRRRVITVTRQWARHSGRSAPEISGQIGARSHHDTLHSGGKFNSRFTATSGGLHGVGISVVNALSDAWRSRLRAAASCTSKISARHAREAPARSRRGAEPARDQHYASGPTPRFLANGAFRAFAHFQMARSKAYLYRRRRNPLVLCSGTAGGENRCAGRAVFHFPGGLRDFLPATRGLHTLTKEPFRPRKGRPGHGSVEWAVSWPPMRTASTVPTAISCRRPKAGRMKGLRAALYGILRSYGDLTDNKRAAQITPDDIFVSAAAMLSVFIREPQFQGQTKDRLSSAEAARVVEQAVKDPFDHWLSASPEQANGLLEFVIERAEERARAGKREKETARKSATRKLRLPGKLADCSNSPERRHGDFHRGGQLGRRLRQAGARSRDARRCFPFAGKF